MAANVVPNALITLTKAAPSKRMSLDNSYVLGARILAKADDIDKCVVNVFVMDSDNKGVPGKTVNISGDPKSLNQTVVTDKDGRANFEITSDKEGQFEVLAQVEGVALNQGVKITFRK